MNTKNAKFYINSNDVGFLLSNRPDFIPNLPNCINIILNLKFKLKKKHLIETLVKIDSRYPQLKLGSKFDIKDLSWMRVDKNKIENHFDQLISEANWVVDKSILGSNIREPEYNYPFFFTISGQKIHFRMNHLIGDGIYALKLLEIIISSYQNGVYDITIAQDYNQLIDNNHIESKIRKFEFDFDDVKPIVPDADIGSYVSAQRYILLKYSDKKIEEFKDEIISRDKKARVSSNIIVHMLIYYNLWNLKYSNKQTLFRVVASVSRFFKQDMIFPYNFLYLFDLLINTPKTKDDLISGAIQTSKDLNLILNNKNKIIQELKNSEEEFKNNKKLFIQKNIEEYVETFVTKRMFVMPYLGKLKFITPALLENIENNYIKMSSPIIGSQLMNILSFQIENEINFCITYDSQRLDEDSVKKIFSIFE